MIKFNNLSNESPYIKFKKKYDEAFNAKQKNIEAISISSFSKKLNEVNSRFVNLKYIDKKEFIFFTNYKSPKSNEFDGHDQIAALFFWSSINAQIRLKGLIKKTSKEYNKYYFKNRSNHKNALAISSNQSKVVKSYDEVVEKYNKSLETKNLSECPDYWGGYSFAPYYFEFWEGHDSRLNKRHVFEEINGRWKNFILEP